MHGFKRREAEAFVERREDVTSGAVVEGDEVLVGDHAGEDNVRGEVELGGEMENFVGIDGIFVAGDDEFAVELINGFQKVEGFDEIREVFVAAPDTGIKEIGGLDIVFLENLGNEILILDLMEVWIYSFINSVDFLGGGFEEDLEIFFGVVGNSDDFFCFFNSVFYGFLVGKAVNGGVHFFPRIEGKGEVVDGDDGGAVIKDRCVKMGEVHEVQALFIEGMEKVELFFEGVVVGIGESFLDSWVWWGEFFVFGMVEKKDVMVFGIQTEKIFGEFVNVAADAGEFGRVHSAVDADFFGLGGCGLHGAKGWYSCD